MLYLIEDRDYLKIGYTSNIEERIKTYKITNVYCKLTDIKEGDKYNEYELHKLCDNWKVTGEWFHNCPEVLEIWSKYNSNKIDYRKLKNILKDLSELWNTTNLCINHFIELHNKYEDIINISIKLDTPLMKKVQEIFIPLKTICNNIKKNDNKFGATDLIGLLKSSFNCYLIFDELENLINNNHQSYIQKYVFKPKEED